MCKVTSLNSVLIINPLHLFTTVREYHCTQVICEWMIHEDGTMHVVGRVNMITNKDIYPLTEIIQYTFFLNPKSARF